MIKKLLLTPLLFFFLTTPIVHAGELESLLSRAEQLADLTNSFATRCENDIKLEKRADTEDCDNFLETHALWREADKTFQNLYILDGQPEDEEWKNNSEYRLKAYKHLLNRTKRTAIKLNDMIQRVP